MWYEDQQRRFRGDYKPTPDKNRTFTEEEAAQQKRRRTEVRRAIEDEKINRELEIT